MSRITWQAVIDWTLLALQTILWIGWWYTLHMLLQPGVAAAWSMFSAGVFNLLIITVFYRPYRSFAIRLFGSMGFNEAEEEVSISVFPLWLLTTKGGRITLFTAGAGCMAMTAPVIWG